MCNREFILRKILSINKATVRIGHITVADIKAPILEAITPLLANGVKSNHEWLLVLSKFQYLNLCPNLYFCVHNAQEHFWNNGF